MGLNQNKELKLYYSISEVAEMLGVSETLLRYWEKEFPSMAPRSRGATSGSTRRRTSGRCGWCTTW